MTPFQLMKERVAKRAGCPECGSKLYVEFGDLSEEIIALRQAAERLSEPHHKQEASGLTKALNASLDALNARSAELMGE